MIMGYPRIDKQRETTELQTSMGGKDQSFFNSTLWDFLTYSNLTLLFSCWQQFTTTTIFAFLSFY